MPAGVELDGICPALTPAQSSILRIQPKLRDTRRRTTAQEKGIGGNSQQTATPTPRNRAGVCCARRSWRAGGFTPA